EIGFIGGHPLPHATEDHRSRQRGRIPHAGGAGQKENRLPELGGPSNGFIDSIQPRDAAQKNLASTCPLNRDEQHPAEYHGQQQIVELVPVDPVRLWNGLRQGGGPLLPSDGLQHDVILGAILQLQPLAAFDVVAMEITRRRSCPPWRLHVPDVLFTGGKLGDQTPCQFRGRWTSCVSFGERSRRGRRNPRAVHEYLILCIRSIVVGRSPRQRQSAAAVTWGVEDLELLGWSQIRGVPQLWQSEN